MRSPSIISADARHREVASVRRGDSPSGGLGASAPMHATLYASESCMKLTLDNGENVNATTAAGSTALLWATLRRGKFVRRRSFGSQPYFESGFRTRRISSSPRRRFLGGYCAERGTRV